MTVKELILELLDKPMSSTVWLYDGLKDTSYAVENILQSGNTYIEFRGVEEE